MATTEDKCERCDGDGWIGGEQECYRCHGQGVTYTYDDPRFVKFVEDMQDAGIPTQHYRGRWFYNGPAAVTNRHEWVGVQEIMSATKVRLTTDSMGLETILYPA